MKQLKSALGATKEIRQTVLSILFLVLFSLSVNMIAEKKTPADMFRTEQATKDTGMLVVIFVIIAAGIESITSAVFRDVKAALDKPDEVSKNWIALDSHKFNHQAAALRHLKDQQSKDSLFFEKVYNGNSREKPEMIVIRPTGNIINDHFFEVEATVYIEKTEVVHPVDLKF